MVGYVLWCWVTEKSEDKKWCRTISLSLWWYISWRYSDHLLVTASWYLRAKLSVVSLVLIAVTRYSQQFFALELEKLDHIILPFAPDWMLLKWCGILQTQPWILKIFLKNNYSNLALTSQNSARYWCKFCSNATCMLQTWQSLKGLTFLVTEIVNHWYRLLA